MTVPPDDGMAAWLEAAGLSHIAPALLRETIALAQLPELSDGHLKELGLTIGERLRFRTALPHLRPPAPHPATPPERRPMTIMFVDVVDSTGLSDRLDVEDLIELIRIYREFCDGVIRKFGGHVTQFFGDGIMASFCYPVAHENDAERAVSAGIEIAGGMPLLATPAGEPVQVRIGIATGRVVISDLFSGKSVEERKISGATPNLAARLQHLAAPGGVVVSELTHQLVGGLFECRDAGQQDVRGFGEPQHVFHVVAPRQIQPSTRLSNTPLTPLFGRDDALGQITQAWSRVETAQPMSVVVCGEAGIGKSRLIDSFLMSLPQASAAILRVQTSALDSESPLHPFINLIRVLAAFEAGDSADERFAKLQATIQGPEPDVDLTVLAELLQVRPDPLAPTLSPSAVRARALAAIARQIDAACERSSVCLVFEDLHWADATSLALLAQLSTATPPRRLMILATTRDEAPAADTFRDATTTWITLSRLKNAEIASMIQSMFGDAPVPANVAQRIAERTDGIPLFVEEYIRPLLLANASTDWTNVAPRSLDSISIPMSLHESLMARLDRSGSAKTVAQIASVIGRSARVDMLAQVSDLPPDKLGAALRALQRSGVLHPVSENGVEAFAFGHALVREAAYDSILRDRKRELHARVGEALEAMDPEGAGLQPELLAIHLTEGGMIDRALGYWVTASERSVRRSSLFEAIGLIRRALAAMRTLESTPERTETRLRLMALLGPALIAVRGPGSAEAQQLYADAYQETEESLDTTFHFRFAWGWWRVARNFTLKKERAGTLLTRAKKRVDREMLLQAHHCNWAAHFELGDFCGCIDHVRAGLAVYESGDFSHHASMYGNHDARVCGHGELAQVYWMQGRIAAAADEERLASEWADKLGHLGSRVHAMDMALLHRSFQRDEHAVRDLAAKLVGFTAEHGLTDHRAKGLIFAGWAMGQGGDVAKGLDAIRGGMDRQREIGTIEDFPMYVSMLAETLVAAGKADTAVEVLTAALQEFDSVGLKIWLPEVSRHLGRALLAADPSATAAAAVRFAAAAGLAGQQGATMLALRIAADQATLCERAGDIEGAHDHLAPALAAMPPGQATPETTDLATRAARLARRLGRTRPGKAA